MYEGSENPSNPSPIVLVAIVIAWIFGLFLICYALLIAIIFVIKEESSPLVAILFFGAPGLNILYFTLTYYKKHLMVKYKATLVLLKTLLMVVCALFGTMGFILLCVSLFAFLFGNIAIYPIIGGLSLLTLAILLPSWLFDTTNGNNMFSLLSFLKRGQKSKSSRKNNN